MGGPEDARSGFPEPAPRVYPPERVTLHVCECGRVGQPGHTRCGHDPDHNMHHQLCPTVQVVYIRADEDDQ